MKTKKTVTLTAEIELEYDSELEEFKNALEGYRSCIDKKGDIDGMLGHIVHSLIYYGDDLIEGVGRIGCNGEKPENYCGIDLVSGATAFRLNLIAKLTKQTI